MQLVVDANPVVSILIKPGKPTDLLFVEELELTAPELLFEEVENNVCIKPRRAAGGCLAAAFPASMPGSFLACPRDRRGRSASSLLRLLPPPRVIGA